MSRSPCLLLMLVLVLAACGTINVEPIPFPPPSNTWSPGEGGRDSDPGPPSVRTDHPRLVFATEGHEFGAMEKDEERSHTAVFYNGGNEPLVIREVKTHCGCAAALLSSKTVAPGGRGTLRITMTSGRVPGRRTKTVEVMTNDPKTPVARYPIRWEVIADCGLDPIVLVLRATRAAGEVTSHFRVLTLKPDFDLVIRRVETSSPGLKARVTRLPPNPKMTGYRVDLTFEPSFGSRDFKERVIVHTNSKRDPRLVMDIFGSVRQAILVVPERLYYPRLKPGEVLTRLVYVFREDDKPLEITRVEDPSGLFEVSTRKVNPSRWEVRLDISGEAPKRTVRGSLVVLTNEPSEPRVALPYEIPGVDD